MLIELTTIKKDPETKEPRVTPFWLNADRILSIMPHEGGSWIEVAVAETIGVHVEEPPQEIARRVTAIECAMAEAAR